METNELFEQLDAQWIITPKAVIFSALGGFTAEKDGEKSMEKADLVAKKLAQFLHMNNMAIEVASTDNGFELVFVEQPHANSIDKA